MKENELFVAQVAAAIEAASVWRSLKDVQRTIQAHQEALSEAGQNPLLIQEEWETAEAVSTQVLRTMEGRVGRLWDRYSLALVDRGAADPDQATDELIAGVFRELDRIRELNGSIPTEKMHDWWERCSRL